ncbi:nuclear distribution protein nudE homolog isoform X2 [Rhagoletis pomonella]|uniref:nuclear distribution protein nudE homolog isoform X2 n=1 Tax=Rhagoletis pomonella TaxID=28610 RepID=UPI0017859F29|nr:nuclear distribution protein nudE homolog isoform X2 [Rhagoletis pomonella]
MESPPMFNSVEDECRYWKERAKLYHKEWTDVKQEYDEYVEQSRQMEAEMDATLEQKQSIIKDLRSTFSSLEKENESLKLKLQSHAIELANTERQLENLRNERDTLKLYLRQLEQKNDDLERAHRILNESIADFETMLDKAYEKNALLEMEVDEKEMLQEKLQRLMDETRDLKQELNVKTRNPLSGSVSNLSETTTQSTAVLNGTVNKADITHDTISPSNISLSTTLNNISLNNTSLTNTLSNSPTVIPNYGEQHSLKNSSNLLNGNAMTPGSRTTALNIVADMLRKLNLDKTLLCSQCERFRCICDRTVAAAADSTSSSASTPVADGVGRLRRSVTSTFGSNNSVDTNATMTSSSTNNSCAEYDADVADVSLRRTTSRSNSSLNFGTNIFKRFAERMSGGNGNFLNSTKTPPRTTNTNIPKPNELN